MQKVSNRLFLLFVIMRFAFATLLFTGCTSEESKNGLMASDLMLYKFHSENTRLQLNNLYEELRRAEARIEAQIKVVVAASQEVSGLDKLEEKQLEEYKYLEAKELQEEILEMVAKKSTEEESLS